MKVIWGYRGPDHRLWVRGPNWWQINVNIGLTRITVIRRWPV